jgi:hypothetical protein
MPPSAAARPVRVLRSAVVAGAGVLVVLVATATPAAAHDVGGGSLPAPPWLLSYIGAFAVAATAVVLRTSWTAPRLTGLLPPDIEAAAPPRPQPTLHLGHLLGIALLGLVLAAAVIGPDSSAANVAPVAALVVWWVGLPIACLLAGDVMRAVNPFVGVVAIVDRRRAPSTSTGPAWTGAAFLAAFAWFFIAYHRPGSPRALAVFLGLYATAAVLGGLRWGRGWLATGEGFGALSAAVALLTPWRQRTAPPPGLVPLMVVWLASSAFDAFTSTPFWADVLGTSQGWSRTFLNTVGLLWLTAIVAGVYLTAVRLADRRDPADEPPSLVEPLGVALVPLALGWFLAHDITLLLFEGQNFIALLSDPIGRGWDLFGTINQTIDYGVVQARWVRWVQLGLLATSHVVAVIVAHDVALRLLRPRAAIRVTWAMAVAAAVSIVAAALLVLG